MAMVIRPPEPPLTDGVVELRPWGEPGDVAAITAACNDRAIVEFLDQIPSPYTEDDARVYTARTQQGWADGTTSRSRQINRRLKRRVDFVMYLLLPGELE
jgi:hypothetical protein